MCKNKNSTRLLERPSAIASYDEDNRHGRIPSMKTTASLALASARLLELPSAFESHDEDGRHGKIPSMKTTTENCAGVEYQ